MPSAYDLFSVRSLLCGEYLNRCTRVGSLLDVSMGSSFVDGLGVGSLSDVSVGSSFVDVLEWVLCFARSSFANLLESRQAG